MFIINDYFKEHPRYICCGEISEYQDFNSKKCQSDIWRTKYVYEGVLVYYEQAVVEDALYNYLYVINNHNSVRHIFAENRSLQRRQTKYIDFECTANDLKLCWFQYAASQQASVVSGRLYMRHSDIRITSFKTELLKYQSECKIYYKQSDKGKTFALQVLFYLRERWNHALCEFDDTGCTFYI